jgi:DNA-binding transcriptional LysR family regulator
VALNRDGEVLLGYAHRLLALNDEAWRRMTAEAFEGEVRVGVPHDIVQPFMPGVLRRFRQHYPRARLSMSTTFTTQLIEKMATGKLDVALTTEQGVGAGGRTLCEQRLCWYGAPGGDAPVSDPIPLAFEDHCAFRLPAIQALEAHGRAWESALELASDSAAEAACAADLAVTARMEGHGADGLTEIGPDKLPPLPPFRINLYVAAEASPLVEAMAEMLADVYSAAPDATRTTTFPAAVRLTNKSSAA